MPEVLAGLPRAPEGKKNHGYEDSNRYLRGRVLARLREAAGGLELREIHAGLDGKAVYLPRLWNAVRSLEADGLARTASREKKTGESPGSAGAVAEERAVYGAGAEDLAGIRVVLP